MSVCVHHDAVRLDWMCSKYCSCWSCHACTNRPLTKSDSGSLSCSFMRLAADVSWGACRRRFHEFAKRSWLMIPAICGFVGNASNILWSFCRSVIISCIALISGHCTTCMVVSLGCKHLGHLSLSQKPILFMYFPVASWSIDILQMNLLMHPLVWFHAFCMLMVSIMWNCVVEYLGVWFLWDVVGVFVHSCWIGRMRKWKASCCLNCLQIFLPSIRMAHSAMSIVSSSSG